MLRLWFGGTFDPVHNGHLAIARAARDELSTPVRLLPAADPPHRAAPGADAAQRVRMLELAIGEEPGLVLDRRELARPGPSYSIDTVRGLRAESGPDCPLALLVGADSFLSLPEWRDWRALFDQVHFVVAERAGSPLGPARPEGAPADAAADAAEPDGAAADFAEPGAAPAAPAHPAPVAAGTGTGTARLPPALAAVAAGRWAGTPAELEAAPAGRIYRLRQPLRPESATGVRALIAAGRPWQDRVPAPVADFIRVHGLYTGSGYNPATPS